MSAPRLICLGCGDAFSARWYSSCLAVEAEGARLLIDCPHPIRKVLRESGLAATGRPLDVPDLDAVVLTHLHADHASGLEGLGFFAHFVLGRPAVVLTHPDVAAQLWDHHLSASMSTVSIDPEAPELRGLSSYFEVHALNGESATEFGPFAIECRRTLHPIPTFALRLRAGGRCLGYSADTAFDPALIDWLADADLIVHETNLGLHTPYERLAALPEALRARMRLIHYPDDFDPEASLIEPLRQGHAYEV
jgi:ribonuclease BN (tRNA processing enzyme)